jgi:hypothetical protein
LSLNKRWIEQNYVSTIFQLFKILNPPLFFSRRYVRGGRGILNNGILICFILSAKKFIEKLMRLKEKKNSKMIVEKLDVYA